MTNKKNTNNIIKANVLSSKQRIDDAYKFTPGTFHLAKKGDRNS